MAPQGEYLGWGNSAYSFMNEHVFCHEADVSLYIKAVNTGRSPVKFNKKATLLELASRFLVLGLKFLHVKHADFESRFGLPMEYLFSSQLSELSGKRIAILGLNSAWASGSQKEFDGEVNDENYLLVGERQVRDALETAKDVDIRIAAMHHPFDWLKEFDANDVEPLLKQFCDFILHGHLHRTRILRPIDPDSQTMVIASGACYESRDYQNMYNFVRLNFEAGKGTVYFRRYSFDPIGCAKHDNTAPMPCFISHGRFDGLTRLKITGLQATVHFSINHSIPI